jgi:hypothetical protein
MGNLGLESDDGYGSEKSLMEKRKTSRVRGNHGGIRCWVQRLLKWAEYDLKG